MFQEERFRKLIEAVENAKDERFDMGHWGKQVGCGTSACAAGSYVLQNPGCGLEMIWEAGDPYGEIVVAGDGHNPCGTIFDTIFDTIVLLASHFGIDEEDANDLFLPNGLCDNDRPAVLARLRAFYAEHKQEPAHAPA